MIVHEARTKEESRAMARSQYEHSDPTIGATYLSHPRRSAMLILKTPAKNQISNARMSNYNH